MSCLVRALVAIVAIAASVGLGGAAPANATPERHLFLVADLVALGAVPAIRAGFAGWDVAVEGHQGIFTDDAAELAWAIATRSGRSRWWPPAAPVVRSGGRIRG
jgi:hypothetical protein